MPLRITFTQEKCMELTKAAKHKRFMCVMVEPALSDTKATFASLYASFVLILVKQFEQLGRFGDT